MVSSPHFSTPKSSGERNMNAKPDGARQLTGSEMLEAIRIMQKLLL